MIPKMAHQPKSKELTYNHASIQAQNTKTQETTPNVHTHKIAKQQNNVLKSQITKRDI
jgi:hypothetical protein